MSAYSHRHDTITTKVEEPLKLGEPVTRAVDPVWPVELVELCRGLGPRDRAQLLTDARNTGAALGSAAFYRYRRDESSDELVVGARWELAKALQLEWGRCRCRLTQRWVSSMRVELRACFDDLYTLTTSDRGKILDIEPPRQGQDLASEKAAQVGAASSLLLRDCILSALPGWFVQTALDAAIEVADHQIMSDDQGAAVSLQAATSEAVFHWASVSILPDQLERYVKRTAERWTVVELRILADEWAAIQAGTRSLADFRAACDTSGSAASGVATMPGRDAAGLRLVSDLAPDQRGSLIARLTRWEAEVSKDLVTAVRKSARIVQGMAHDVLDDDQLVRYAQAAANAPREAPEAK